MRNYFQFNISGKEDLLSDSSMKLGIVGSRLITPYTKFVLEELFDELRNYDFCIVSGGMYGVDLYAHNLALKNNLKTIIVLAEGIESYKSSSLYNQLRFSNNPNYLFLSEYESYFKARKYTFLQRNKVIVNLSSCLLLAQASLNSGSMSTANFALKSNKKIYSVPFALNESKFQGSNWLIDCGSKIYLNPNSILESFSIFSDSMEKSIKNCIKYNPSNFVNLKNLIGCSDSLLNKELLKLILKGDIFYDGEFYYL
jgi:DNA processing protein